MRRGLRDHDANLAYERGVARDRICVAIAIGRGARNESELAESLVRALRAPNAAPNRAATVSAMRRTVPVAGDADDRDILTRRRASPSPCWCAASPFLRARPRVRRP